MSELRSRRYRDDATGVVLALPAGDVTEGVVRIGNTVRRPHQPQSYAVAAYLDHLERAGFEGAPRYLGRDDDGRDVLSFIEGEVAGATLEEWALADELIGSVARLLRRLHDASTGYDPADEPFPARPRAGEATELVSHLDVTPQNVVVRGGEAFAVIDFDLAGPTTRFRDAYNTAMHWVPLRDPVDIESRLVEADQLRRLRIFADAFGWSAEERAALPRYGAVASERSWARMRERAENDGGGWARMWAEGVGDVILRRRDWLIAREGELVRALLSEGSDLDE